MAKTTKLRNHSLCCNSNNIYSNTEMPEKHTRVNFNWNNRSNFPHTEGTFSRKVRGRKIIEAIINRKETKLVKIGEDRDGLYEGRTS